MRSLPAGAFAVSLLLAILVSPAPVLGQARAPGPWRQLADPESAGWSTEGLLGARRYADEIGTTAAMVVERGHVVAAWGDVTKSHNVFSIRKSLLGALFGLAVRDGDIDLGTTLEELGIDDDPPLTPQERTASIADLLRARSGVYHAAAFETAGMEQYRPDRDRYEPGSHWFYNNWDFNTLSTIYQNLVGEEVFPAFEKRLAHPLGMEDFRLDRDTRYRVERNKSIHPAYLFYLSARDLARIGQLWLQEGRWGEAWVVPKAWVRASVTSYSQAFDGGYGTMSWWTYPAHFAAEYGYDWLRHYDSYMTTGSGGQVVWVIPDLDLVFVHVHERVGESRVGSPAYWTLLDRVLAARTGSAYRGTGPEVDPVDGPTLAPLRWEPLGNGRPPSGAEIMEGETAPPE